MGITGGVAIQTITVAVLAVFRTGLSWYPEDVQRARTMAFATLSISEASVGREGRELVAHRQPCRRPIQLDALGKQAVAGRAVQQNAVDQLGVGGALGACFDHQVADARVQAG